MNANETRSALAGSGFAHSLPDRPTDQWQPLEEHLEQVARAAARIETVAVSAISFGSVKNIPMTMPCHFLFLFVVTLIAGLSSGRAVEACTLWGAAGGAVAGGGTLIAKNRDWVPDHRQELRVVQPRQGYRSLVLVAVGGAEPGVKAGVNEKGLVIVSATAGEVPAGERRAADRNRGVIGRLLARCAGVEDLLAEIGIFDRPAFYLVGDRKEIALIEVAPDGSRAVSRTASGSLHHTNHYLAADPGGLARRPSASSRARAARIAELLESTGRAYTIADFIRFSEDRHAGPDNSIWRRGGEPSKRRTLAAWIVALPESGRPQLYLKLANPGEAERVCAIDVQAALSLPPEGGGDRLEGLCRPLDAAATITGLDSGPSTGVSP